MNYLRRQPRLLVSRNSSFGIHTLRVRGTYRLPNAHRVGESLTWQHHMHRTLLDGSWKQLGLLWHRNIDPVRRIPHGIDGTRIRTAVETEIKGCKLSCIWRRANAGKEARGEHTRRHLVLDIGQ